MEEIGDADAIHVVADVAGRSAADVEEGQTGDDRGDPGHDLDGAERIAEDARDLPHLGARERDGARRLLVRPANEDLRDALRRGRLRLGGRRGGRTPAGGVRPAAGRRDRRRPGGARGRGLQRGLRRGDGDLDADARGDAGAAAHGRLVAPCERRADRDAGEGLVLFGRNRGAHRPVGVHSDGQQHVGVAGAVGRIGHVLVREEPRWLQRGRRWRGRFRRYGWRRRGRRGR